MNTTLETVEDYVTDTRRLLQDEVVPYRYDDASVLMAFNVTLLEARRLRPDLFVFTAKTDGDVPTFTAVDTSKVYMEAPFRLALVFGTVSHTIARDQEDVQDRRASSFMDTFTEMLTGVKVPAIAGAAPRGEPA